MLITKSLFVEYRKLPKLARRKKHDDSVYKKIRKIETEEQEQHILQIGMAVESAVVEFFEQRYGAKATDLMPDFSPDSDEDNEDEDYFLRRTTFDPHALMANTIEAIKR
jgi:hypothetical protein